MGFGILFVGYLITYLMSLNPLGPVFHILGYAVMALGLSRLNRYHTSFFYATVASIALLISSLVGGILLLAGYLYDNLILSVCLYPPIVQAVLEILNAVLIFLFHALLLWSIRAMAHETELPKLGISAIRNFVFICLSYLINLTVRLPMWDNEMKSYFNLAYVLLQLSWILLDLWLLYSCYAKICDENDGEMQRKASRFAFVNRFRDAFDQRENRAIEADRAYHAERRCRRKGKKK